MSWLAALVVGALIGLAITSADSASLVMIPLLAVTIGILAMLSDGAFDIILFLVAGAAFLLPMNRVRLGANLTVGDGFIIIALVLILIIRADQRGLRLPGMAGLVVGVVMVVWGGLLGSFFAASIGASLAGLIRFGAATIALPILFGLWRPRLSQLRIIAWSIVLGSAVDAAIGIVSIRVVGRAQGLTTHPNHLALGSLMAVGAALGLALSTHHPVHHLLLLGAIAVLTVGILSSGSRSGLIAEIVVVVVVAILTHNRILILASVTAATLFPVMLALGQFGRSGTSAVSRLLGGGGVAASDQARAETLRSALHAFSLHPLTGQGFQAALATHDIVLELASTAGVFGLLGFGVVSWTTARPMWRRYRWGMTRRRSPGDTLLIGSIAAVLGFLANGLFGNELYDRYIWMVITLAAALSYEVNSADRESLQS